MKIFASKSQGIVLQYADCITLIVLKVVATCEPNENGRFSAQLQLLDWCLNVKSKIPFFEKYQDI